MRQGVGSDPYVRWFWDSEPDWSTEQMGLLERLYAPLFDALQQEEV